MPALADASRKGAAGKMGAIDDLGVREEPACARRVGMIGVSHWHTFSSRHTNCLAAVIFIGS